MKTKTLNLTNPLDTDLYYEYAKFPDGQQQIKITSRPGSTTFLLTDSIQIKSRLNNFLDLELIICAVASLREMGIKEIHLYVPYILGARSDRKFEEGSNNYLKTVICPIINSLKFDTVTCIDPHSDVLEACINNFKKKSLDYFYNFCIDAIKSRATNKSEPFDYVLVSPDAGASKKIYKVAEHLKYKGEVLTCSKDRDKDGKLTKCVVPVNFEHVGKNIVIIDDICDGGATFINIAKEIKREFAGSHTKNKIYLIITHGIFSKGLNELQHYFDGIYCSNSYSDHLGLQKDYPHILNQLSAF